MNFLVLFFVVISYLFIPFSPFVSYVLFIIILPFIKRDAILSLIPGVIISFALISVSRGLFLTSSDDFETYYTVYSDPNFISSFLYFGTEVGLPLLNNVISLIIGHVEPKILLLVYVLFQISLSIFIIYKTYEFFHSKGFLNDKVNLGLFLSISLAFFPFFAFTIYIRQCIALLFLCLGFFIERKFFKYLFFTFSFITHHALIFIYFFIFGYNFIVKSRHFKIYYLSFLIIFLPLFMSYLTNHFYAVDKIRAWFVQDKKFSLLVFISQYKYLVSAILLSCFLRNKKILYFLFFIFITALIIDDHIPYISVRFFMPLFIFSGVIFAVIISMLDSSFKISNLVLILLFLFSVRCYTLVNTEGAYNDLFYSYGVISSEPFYYLNDLNKEFSTRHRNY